MKRFAIAFFALLGAAFAVAMEAMPMPELQIADATSSGCGAVNLAILRYGYSGGSAGVTHCDGANAFRGLEAGKFQLVLMDEALVPASFQGKKIPAFREVLVAYVNLRNRVQSVPKEKLVTVWCGIRPAWSAVGGDASDIHRYGIVAGRPGGDTIMELLKIRTPGMGVTWLNSTAEVVLYASRDAAALSLGRYQEEYPGESVRVLAIDGVLPDRKNISSGKYPLMRRYVWLVSADGEEKVKKLLPFFTRDEFRRSLLEEDLLPE